MIRFIGDTYFIKAVSHVAGFALISFLKQVSAAPSVRKTQAASAAAATATSPPAVTVPRPRARHRIRRQPGLHLDHVPAPLSAAATACKRPTMCALGPVGVMRPVVSSFAPTWPLFRWTMGKCTRTGRCPARQRV